MAAAHNRLAGKKPTPLSPKKGQGGPLSSVSDDEQKKKKAMIAAFKGRH